MDGRTLIFISFFLSLTLVSSWLNTIERHYFGVKEEVVLENIAVERLLEGEVRDVVEELAIRQQKVPVEPRLDKASGKIIDEQEGLFIDVEGTVQRVMTAQVAEQVDLIRVRVPTKHTGEEIRKVNQVLGRYATSIYGSSQRVQNIRVATICMNNTLIWPGEEFSFNDTTGPRTAERGYLPAPIILNGGFDMGLGGGVCQVSSTLYNAALKAKLAIIERHAHTKEVHYVPLGKDATVDYGSLDLKWQNNTKQPLIIKMYVSGGRITAEIWGGKEE